MNTEEFYQKPACSEMQRNTGKRPTRLRVALFALCDFLILVVLCTCFVALKGSIFLEHSSKHNSNLGILYLWFGSLAAVDCFPAVFIGLRLFRSKWTLCICSWVTVCAIAAFNNWSGANLIYIIAGRYVRDENGLTNFGIFYEIILSPQFVMAIISTLAIIVSHARRWCK
jgi:hypothetical protein